MMPNYVLIVTLLPAIGSLLIQPCRAADLEPVVPVVAQPLAANVTRLVEALDFLGASLPADVKRSLAESAQKPDADRLQQVLDEHALFERLLVRRVNPLDHLFAAGALFGRKRGEPLL